MTADESEKLVEFEGPRYRPLVNSLRLLSKTEIEIEERPKELHEIVTRLVQSIDDELVGKGNPRVLAVSPYIISTDGRSCEWSVTFRARPILTFRCSAGSRSSPRPVIAECRIEDADRSGPATTLHLTKNNGSGVWVVESDLNDVRPGISGVDIERILVGLLQRYAERENRKYRAR